MLREENMETLKATPNTERYIAPITEITHLNHVETIHEVKPEKILIPITELPILTSSEAVEIDAQDQYVAPVHVTEEVVKIDDEGQVYHSMEIDHLGHKETVHEVNFPSLEQSTTYMAENSPLIAEHDVYEPTREALDDRSIEEVKKDEQDDDLYNIKNFAL
jgi:hypothetical protein